MELIITEKPSVAKDIAKVLGINKNSDGYMSNDKYYITWAIGHLISLGTPNQQNPSWQSKENGWQDSDLPMLPEHFMYVINPKTKKQFNVIKDLIHRKEVDGLINAGDDGREGEYIQRLIYAMAKNTKPIKRLRISSMDKKSIEDGFKNLVPNSVMDNIFESAKCRAWSDWKIGMNFSELVCLKNKVSGFTVGRVQTPTVAIIRDRNDAIKNFVSKDFFQVKAFFDKDYYGILIDENSKEVKFDDKDSADKVISFVKGEKGEIKSLEEKKQFEERPFLYNLSGLQIDANKKFGYSSDKTLKLCQSLYETHKIVTYPRTDAKFLTSSISSKMKDYVKAIADKGYPVNKTDLINGLLLDKHIVDDAKVSDHHAIIINDNYANFHLKNLSEEEKNILELITNRMLVAFSPKYEYEQTTIITKIKDKIFRSVGKKPIEYGWKKTAKILGAKISEPKENQEFVGISLNDKVTCVDAKRLDKKTNPPKQLTEAELLKIMVNVGTLVEDKELKSAINNAKGLGTEATRSSIIKNIQDRGYVEVKKKCFYVTEKGRALLKFAPERLTSPIMSAEWEYALSEIEKGKKTSKDFNAEIDDYIRDVVKNYVGNSSGYSPQIESIGICPKCKGKFIKGKYGYYCENKCGFILNKYRGKNLTDAQKKNLLQGKSVVVKKLKAKSGNEYNMKITPTGQLKKSEYEGKTYYSMEFEESFSK